MRRLGVRVARVTVALPKPSPPRDPSRLTLDQRERAMALGERIRAVGLPGLTDAEVAEAGTLARLLEVHRTGEA